MVLNSTSSMIEDFAPVSFYDISKLKFCSFCFKCNDKQAPIHCFNKCNGCEQFVKSSQDNQDSYWPNGTQEKFQRVKCLTYDFLDCHVSGCDSRFKKNLVRPIHLIKHLVKFHGLNVQGDNPYTDPKDTVTVECFDQDSEYYPQAQDEENSSHQSPRFNNERMRYDRPEKEAAMTKIVQDTVQNSSYKCKKHRCKYETEQIDEIKSHYIIAHSVDIIYICEPCFYVTHVAFSHFNHMTGPNHGNTNPYQLPQNGIVSTVNVGSGGSQKLPVSTSTSSTDAPSLKRGLSCDNENRQNDVEFRPMHKKLKVEKLKKLYNKRRIQKRVQFYCGKKMCTYKTSHVESIKSHYHSKHSVEQTFVCERCFIVTHLPRTYENHLKLFHPNENHHVDTIKFRQSQFDVSTFKHKNEPIHKSSLVCETTDIIIKKQSTDKVQGLKVMKSKKEYHKKIPRRLETFKCGLKRKICGYETPSAARIKAHFIKMHSIDNVFVCEKCFFVTNVPKTYRKHMINRHNSNLPVVTSSEIKDKHNEINLHEKHTLPLKDVTINTIVLNKNSENIPASKTCIESTKNIRSHDEYFDSKIRQFTGLKCVHCSFQTKYNNVLKKHIVANHISVISTVGAKDGCLQFHCRKCKKTSVKRSRISSHFVSSHMGPENGLLCECCSNTFYGVCRFKHHLESKLHKANYGNAYHCKTCGFGGASEESLKEHQQMEHSQIEVLRENKCYKDTLVTNSAKVFNCDICCFSTKYSQGLNRHLVAKHGQGVMKKYYCNKCSYSSYHRANVRRHDKICRGIERVKNNSNSTVNSASVDSPNTAVNSVDAPNAKSENIDFKSSFSVESEKSLEEYKGVEHGQTQTLSLNKNDNNQKKSMASNQNTHKKIASSEGTDRHRFECGICFYSTNNKHNLARHLSTIRHKIKVSKNVTKIFQCDICSYSTTNRQSLNRHLVVKHSKGVLKMFYCNKCSYSSYNAANVQRHDKICKGIKRVKFDSESTINSSSVDSPYTESDDIGIAKDNKDMVSPQVNIGLNQRPDKLQRLNMTKLKKKNAPVFKFRCTECNYSSQYACLIKRHALSMHYMAQDKNHNGLYECRQCSFITKEKKRYRLHIRVMHSEEGKKFSCEKCSFVSHSKQGLKKHHHIHDD